MEPEIIKNSIYLTEKPNYDYIPTTATTTTTIKTTTTLQNTRSPQNIMLQQPRFTTFEEHHTTTEQPTSPPFQKQLPSIRTLFHSISSEQLPPIKRLRPC